MAAGLAGRRPGRPREVLGARRRGPQALTRSGATDAPGRPGPRCVVGERTRRVKESLPRDHDLIYPPIHAAWDGRAANGDLPSRLPVAFDCRVGPEDYNKKPIIWGLGMPELGLPGLEPRAGTVKEMPR